MLIKATPGRKAFFAGMLSIDELLQLAKERQHDRDQHPLMFGLDVNAARYVNGQRETPNGEVGRGTPTESRAAACTMLRAGLSRPARRAAALAPDLCVHGKSKGQAGALAKGESQAGATAGRKHMRCQRPTPPEALAHASSAAHPTCYPAASPALCANTGECTLPTNQNRMCAHPRPDPLRPPFTPQRKTPG